MAVLDEDNRMAFSLLQRALAADMPAERRQEAEQLYADLQSELAREAATEASALMEAGRMNEAEVLIEQMIATLGSAPELERAKLALQSRRLQRQRERTWRETMARAEKLLEQDKHHEAIQQYASLLPMTTGRPEERKQVAEHIRNTVQAWSESILEATDPAAASRFLAAHQDSRTLRNYAPEPSTLATMHMMVAAQLRRRLDRNPDLYDEARTHYQAAARLGDRQTGRRAERQMQELAEWLAHHRTEQMLAGLRKKGLASEHWQVEKTGKASARMADGVLQMRAEKNPMAARLQIGTAHPLRRADFRVEVKMQAGPMDPERPGTVGIELRDGQERFFRFYFDGEDYRINVRGAGAPVKQAFGNESTTWHTMGLTYEPLEERITVLLDGEELRSFEVTLFRPRVLLYLEAPAGTSTGVNLKDFQLDQ
jgi:tetratricopeptide (TPR) repeat protein